MSDLERELRETLHDRAGATSARVEAPTDLADRVRARRTRQRALAGGGALALALVVAVSTLAVLDAGDDGQDVLVGGAGAPSEIAAVTSDGDLVVLDTETGGVLRTLVDGSTTPVAPDTPAVTPDGRSAYVTFEEGCEAAIVKADLLTGVGPGALPAVIANGAAPALSPDGTQLAFLACDNFVPSDRLGEGTLRTSEMGTAVAVHDLVELSTSGWELRVDHDDWLADVPVAWTDDGRVLVRVSEGPGGPSPLRLLDAERLGPVEDAPTIELPELVRLLGSLGASGELLGGADSSDVVAIDATTGEVARVLFNLRSALPATASADPTGRHVLVVDERGALWSWSEGDDVARHVADGIASAAWIPERVDEPVTTTTESPSTSTSTTGSPTTSTSTIPAPRCSAFPMKIAVGPDPSLPAPVQATWSAILQAATACDWDALRALMVDDFSYSVVQAYSADAAIAEWQDDEARGEPILRTLVERLLDEPRVVGVDPPFVYEWPDPTSDLLYRAGIREDGAWVSFLAGD
jgi:hypothetical protein